MGEAMAFQDGVLAGHSSVKGFEVCATDGRAGRVSWATYKPGESYLVVTLGLVSRKHHVVPAGAVTSVGDRKVHVALSRAQIEQLPLVSHPQAAVDDERSRQMMAAFERAAHEWPMQN